MDIQNKDNTSKAIPGHAFEHSVLALDGNCSGMRHWLVAFTILLLTVAVPAFSASSSEAGKTVVMGYYSEPGLMNGAEDGKAKSGYAYEYIQELSSHAGWKYKYVYGSFRELYQKLLKGEIDMLPYITYTEARAKEILFPEMAMGWEQFYLASMKPDKLSDGLSELQGRKVGTNKGAFHIGPFNDLLTQKGITCELVESTSPEDRWAALEKGEIDFSIETSTVFQTVPLHAVREFGDKYPYYLVVAPERKDLLAELNAAQHLLEEVDPAFLETMKIKYFKGIPLFREIPKDGLEWLNGHDSIKIGAYNNDEPYIIKNEDGTVTGIAAAQVALMLDSLNIKCPVEWKIYPGRQQAIEALAIGEIDCINPYYHNYADAERDGLVISKTVYISDFCVLYRDQYTSKTLSVIATPQTRLGASYVRENYPQAMIVPCQDGYECIEKLDDGKASCVVMHMDALQNIASKYGKRHKIKVLETGCDVCFATLPKNVGLISIFNKAIPFITDAERSAIQDKFSIENHTPGIVEVIQNYPEYFYGSLAVLCAILLAMVFYKNKKEKEIAERKKQAEAYKKIVDRFAAAYENVLIGNLNEGTYKVVSCSKEQSAIFAEKNSLAIDFDRYLAQEVHPDDREALLRERISFGDVKGKLDIGESHRLEYRGKGRDGYIWYRTTLNRISENEILIGFKDCDEEIRRQKEQLLAAEESRRLIDSLLKNYNIVYKVRLSDASYELLKMEDNIVGYGMEFEDFNKAREFFISKVAYEPDREMLGHEMAFDTIREKLKTETTYSIEYRAVVDGIAIWHEMIISSLGGDEIAVAYAVKDTEILMEHIHKTMFDNYDGIYVVNYNADQLKVLRATGISNGKPAVMKYSAFTREFASRLKGEEKDYFAPYVNPEYAKHALQKDGKMEHYYRSPNYGDKPVWVKCEIHVLTWNSGMPETAVICTARVDSMRSENIELDNKLKETNKLISALTKDFGCVVYLNLSEQYDEIVGIEYRTSDEVKKIIPEWREELPFRIKLDLLIDNVVYEADREYFYKETRRKALIEKLRDVDTVLINYRVLIKGEIRYHQLKFSAVRENGELLGIVAGFHSVDETVRKEVDAQKKLQEALTFANFYLDTYVSAYYIGLNTMSCKVYKRSQELEDKYPILSNYLESLNKYISTDVHPDDREELMEITKPENLRKALARQPEITHAFRDISNGVEKIYRFQAIRGADEDHIAFGFMDITEEIKKQQDQRIQLEDALAKAEAANKAKTEFLFNMSHDIRTPMNAILGFTGMAQKHLDDREKVSDCLTKTKQSGNLLLALINSVLDMSRIEAGNAELQENPGDVYYSFVNIETAMQEIAATRDIKLKFEFGEIKDRYVFADFQICIRIFTNLIANAIKYSHEGGYVNVFCEQATQVKDGYASYRYTIEDNGLGMSEEFQKRMFEAFTREHNSTASGIQGTGLGLSVCKTFVEFLNGTIECRSKVGEGTTFTVTLPFKVQAGKQFTDPASGEIVAVEEKKDHFSPVDFNGKKVLLVEDNELNREIAIELLQEEGLTVEEAENGMMAVDMLKEKGPDYYDFVLMDIQMPVMNGYDATKAIRAMYPDAKLPIIALSANAFAEDKIASLAAGMNAHVAKPIKTKELFSALGKFIQ